MKLEFNSSKPNTSDVQLRSPDMYEYDFPVGAYDEDLKIDLDTKKKLTVLKKCYGVGAGVLIKQMISQCYESLPEADK